MRVSRRFVMLVVAIAAVAFVPLPLLAQTRAAAKTDPAVQLAKSGSSVQPAVMQKLLPKPTGWSKLIEKTETATLSPTSSYTYAYALYMNEAMKIRVTIADTGGDEGALTSLATMIMTFKDDYNGQIPPATTVKRSVYKGSSAAELWDASSNDGEFTVLVNNRFVVKVEGSHLNDQAIPRAIVDSIDLNALVAAK